MTAAAALAFLVFNLFTPPCFAAIGAMNAEIKSKKWLFAGVGLQLAVGFILGFLTFFIGSLISGQSVGEFWMPVLGFAITISFAIIVTAMILKNKRKIKA